MSELPSKTGLARVNSEGFEELEMLEFFFAR